MQILLIIGLGIIILTPMLALSVCLHYYSPIHGGGKHDVY